MTGGELSQYRDTVKDVRPTPMTTGVVHTPGSRRRKEV